VLINFSSPHCHLKRSHINPASSTIKSFAVSDFVGPESNQSMQDLTLDPRYRSEKRPAIPKPTNTSSYRGMTSDSTEDKTKSKMAMRDIAQHRHLIFKHCTRACNGLCPQNCSSYNDGRSDNELTIQPTDSIHLKISIENNSLPSSSSVHDDLCSVSSDYTNPASPNAKDLHIEPSSSVIDSQQAGAYSPVGTNPWNRQSLHIKIPSQSDALQSCIEKDFEEQLDHVNGEKAKLEQLLVKRESIESELFDVPLQSPTDSMRPPQQLEVKKLLADPADGTVREWVQQQVKQLSNSKKDWKDPYEVNALDEHAIPTMPGSFPSM